MNLITNFEQQSQSVQFSVGFTLIGVIGIIDFLTGYEISFSVLYVIPVSFVTWYTNRRLGFVISIASAFVWLAADIAPGNLYSHPLIPIWNSLVRLVFFVIITLLLSSLKSVTERERELSRIDYLTGAVNSRFFHHLVQMEIDRFQRYEHTFTSVYIDLDNFKSVNDQLGHSVGDQVLRKVVSSAGKHLRKTDVIARLSGDEFALLLPETQQESARVVLSKIQGRLLEEMRQHNWPITFSIGVLTCSRAPSSSDRISKTS